MKIFFTEDWTLTIIPDNHAEAFALEAWSKRYFNKDTSDDGSPASLLIKTRYDGDDSDVSHTPTKSD